MAFKLIFVMIAVSVAAVSADYCKLCDNHVACPEDTKPNATCKGIPAITQQMKDLILDEHNKLRNKLAAGQVPRFQSATRMSTLVWDDELAYLAYFNSKKCYFGHDACRKTYMFPSAGQNIAGKSVKGNNKYPEINDVIIGQTQSWFNEYEYTDPAVIKAYAGTGDPNKANGHFTQIARDVAIKVGCSLSQYIKPGDWYTVYYVCNYGVTNIVGGQIYEEGPTASKCKTGTNPKYPSLCSVNEKYDDSGYINYF